MAGTKRFLIVLIKPSHYDDDGYVIQWFRSPIPSNSLASVYSLIDDSRRRKVLGDDVDIEIEYQVRNLGSHRTAPRPLDHPASPFPPWNLTESKMDLVSNTSGKLWLGGRTKVQSIIGRCRCRAWSPTLASVERSR